MSHRKKQQKDLASTSEHCGDGNWKDELPLLKLLADIDAMESDRWKNLQEENLQLLPYCMQEFPRILKEMTCNDRLSFLSQNIQKQKSFQKLEVGSIIGGENFSQFWNEYSKAIFNKLSLPILTDSSDLGLNWLAGYVKSMSVKSWFSMTVNSVPMKNSFKISCPSSIASLADCTGYASTKNKSGKRRKTSPRHQKSQAKQSPNSVLKIRVYPSKELHCIWKSWLSGYRWYYNETIALLRCFDGVEKITAYSMDKVLQLIENKPSWVSLPGHQRQEACNDACDAFQSAKSENGFAKFKSCKAKSQVIKFKAGNYKNGTWYPKTTKGLKYEASQSVPYQCEYGTQLVYQRGKWFACFPQVVKAAGTGSDRVVALDPGNRTFLTGYDGENVLEIGKGDIGRIQRLCLHLDSLISRSTKVKARQRRKMRIACDRIREKIQNLVKDLHNKAVNLLVNSYKLIYLPTFDSSQMVVKINGKGKKRKINSKSARQMLTLSHYRFEQHLKQAASRKGVIVALVNESYTSKTCPNCGHIHAKLGGNKKFQCPKCKYSAPRDWNGALNIMIRALQATAFTFSGDAIVIDSSRNI